NSEQFPAPSGLQRAGSSRQTPERSGLPSAVRGAVAVRLGLPFGKRGIPGVGKSHCASSGAEIAVTMRAAKQIFMIFSCPLLGRDVYSTHIRRHQGNRKG